MYKLTERRLALAEQILEKHRSFLAEHDRFDTQTLERELRDIWTNVGYQELKGIMIDMLKNHERYQYVAAYYMERSNPMGVSAEFKSSLAKAYGVKYFHGSDTENAKQEFWDTAKAELSEEGAA